MSVMVVHACNPSTWKVNEHEGTNSWLAWATYMKPVSEKKYMK